MPLVQAKCTNCGAGLQVDDAKEAAVCPHCHTAYVVQDAINHYVTNIYNQNTIHADEVNIHAEGESSVKARAGETFLQLGEKGSAREVFTELTQKYPFEYRGWWGLIRLETEDFSKTELTVREQERVRGLYKKALTVCAEPETIRRTFESYDGIVSANLAASARALEQEAAEARERYQETLDRLDEEHEGPMRELEERRQALENEIGRSGAPDLKKKLLIAAGLVACWVLLMLRQRYWGVTMEPIGYVVLLALCAIPYYFITEILLRAPAGKRKWFVIIEIAFFIRWIVGRILIMELTPRWILFFILWTAFEVYVWYVGRKQTKGLELEEVNKQLSVHARALENGKKDAKKEYEKQIAPIREKDTLGVLDSKLTSLQTYLDQ